MSGLVPIDEVDCDYLRIAIQARLENEDMALAGETVNVIVDVAALWAQHTMTTHAMWPLKHQLKETRQRITALLDSNARMRETKAQALKRATTLECALNRARKEIKAKGGSLDSGDLFNLLIARVRDEVSK